MDRTTGFAKPNRSMGDWIGLGIGAFIGLAHFLVAQPENHTIVLKTRQRRTAFQYGTPLDLAGRAGLYPDAKCRSPQTLDRRELP